MKPHLQPFKILLIDDDEDDHAFVHYLLSDFSISDSQLHWAVDNQTAKRAPYVLSNALKYPFSGHRDGRIIVALQPLDSQNLVLSGTDNGGGLRPGVEPAKPPKLSLQLVSNLAAQLGRRLTSDRSGGGGISLKVLFPVPRMQHHEGEP